MAEKMSKVHVKSSKNERVTQGLGLGGWLTILVVLSMFIYDAINISYRHALLAAGGLWPVNRRPADGN